MSLEARIREDFEMDVGQPEPVSKTQSNNCDSSKEGGQTSIEQSGPDAMDVGSEESEAGEMGSVSGSCEIVGNLRSTFTEVRHSTSPTSDAHLSR